MAISLELRQNLRDGGHEALLYMLVRRLRGGGTGPRNGGTCREARYLLMAVTHWRAAREIEKPVSFCEAAVAKMYMRLRPERSQ